MAEPDRKFLWKDGEAMPEGHPCQFQGGLKERIYQYIAEVNEHLVVYHWTYKMDGFEI